jgi:hypothetical protein
MCFRSAIGSSPVPPTFIARSNATYVVMAKTKYFRRAHLRSWLHTVNLNH